MALPAATGQSFGGGDAPVVEVFQGDAWTPEAKREFYSVDQGSRIMPVAWMRALQAPGGGGFLDDGLARYGYLPNADRTDGLPVGFALSADDGGLSIGMTCSACHTRQLVVAGTAYRIDGGPAMSDFQSLLHDLDVAVGAALADDAGFAAFAGRIPAGAAAPSREALAAWHRRFHAIVAGSLPDPAWGPGRLDAISMIINRTAGLDVGTGPDRIIPENIEAADAPTRYPFIWDAWRHERTQWLGFLRNGLEVLSLTRNLGEVYGVFAELEPLPGGGGVGLNRDYVTHNSASFYGLTRAEQLAEKLGRPRWPWRIEPDLAAAGSDVFATACAECHSVRTNPLTGAWKTQVLDAGTDTRACAVLAREVATGSMEGARVASFTGLGSRAPAEELLRTLVIGAILQGWSTRNTPPGMDGAFVAAAPLDGAELEALEGAFVTSGAERAAEFGTGAAGCPFEARVLTGIWAAAPYLHNGSVPSLAELLKPDGERIRSFKLGPAYDIATVGLAAEQSVFDFTLETTGCDALDSGRSNCGHNYGTDLSDADRRALLEYLKTL